MLSPFLGRTLLVGFSMLVLSSGTSCARKSRDGLRPEPEKAHANSPDSPVAQPPQPSPENRKGLPAPTPLGAEQGLPASNVEVLSANALIARLRSSGAKGTLVNIWASWCGPCRHEFPMLVALRDSLTAQNLDVVFVSVDEPETYGAAVDFATTLGLLPPISVAERPLGPFKLAMSPKWPGMLPATFLFDGEGKLRYFWGGPVYEEELLPIVADFLKGKEVDGFAKVPLQAGKDFRLD
jgi:thiol-disulfide isomerase/thioredoxin